MIGNRPHLEDHKQFNVIFHWPFVFTNFTFQLVGLFGVVTFDASFVRDHVWKLSSIFCSYLRHEPIYHRCWGCCFFWWGYLLIVTHWSNQNISAVRLSEISLYRRFYKCFNIPNITQRKNIWLLQPFIWRKIIWLHRGNFLITS